MSPCGGYPGTLLCSSHARLLESLDFFFIEGIGTGKISLKVVHFSSGSNGKLDGQGRARREAARRRKSEWKVNLGSLTEFPLAAMTANE